MKYLLTTLILFLFPLYVSAQTGFTDSLIICNTTKESVTQDITNRCDFNDLIEIGNLLINLIFELSLAVSVVVLLYVGFKYMIAGSSDAKKEAKKSFSKLAIGFAFILGAYLIVNTLFAIAGVNTAFQFLGDPPADDNHPANPQTP